MKLSLAGKNFILPGKMQLFLSCIAAGAAAYLAFFCNLQLLQVITIASGLFLAGLAFKSDKTWIPILFILLPMRGFQLGSVWGAGAIRAGDIFIAYIFLLWLFKYAHKDKPGNFIRSKLDLFIVLFLVFYMLSLFWSSKIDLGLIRVMKFIRNFCFFLLIRELFIKDFRDNYKKLVICSMVMGLAVGLVYLFSIFKDVTPLQFNSLYEKEVLTSIDLGFWRKRITGGGIFLNGASNFLMLSGVFIFGSLVLAQNKFKRWLKIVLIIFMFSVASIGTLSRSAMVSVALILVILLVGNYKINLKQNKRFFISIVLFFAIVIFSLGVHKLVLKRFVNPFQDGSWAQRVDLAKVALKGFWHSPVIGIGPGSNFTWQSLYAEQVASRVPDNLYLNILSEVGAVGFLLFLVIIFLWLECLIKCMQDRDADIYLRNICLAIFAFGLSYLLAALISQEFESFEAWIMLGITSAICSIRARSKELSVQGAS
ncbi:MAG: O-antigen ligase family protein [Candidatus Omnitrophica bacterium]|nr:O-antigen ligase family protein [Candidatus Omnitrophota bacterium]